MDKPLNSPPADSKRHMGFLDASLKPERAWQGKHALVRVETCYTMLNLVTWLVVVTLTGSYSHGLLACSRIG